MHYIRPRFQHVFIGISSLMSLAHRSSASRLRHHAGRSDEVTFRGLMSVKPMPGATNAVAS